MAYQNSSVGSWFGEAAGTQPANLAESRSSFAIWADGKSFEEHFEELFENYKAKAGFDIKRDLGQMVGDRGFMETYKADLLEPIFEGFREISPNDPHIENHIENVNRLWDAKIRQYSESAATTAFLPIATLEFPVLTKQFFASITKDIIEVETVKTPNIVKHIKTTYLVDNQTGDMYEYPKCVFEGTWEKIWDAAKGIPFPSNEPIDITDGKGWNLNLISFATDGDPHVAVDEATAGADGKVNLGNRLSFNIRIEYVDWDDGTNQFTRMPLRGDGRGTSNNGIIPELSNNGLLVGGNLNFKHNGILINDLISGRVDFQTGTMSVSSANGNVKAVYVSGYLSNELNERTVSVKEVRTLQKFMIEDGPRWNMPFSIEEIEDASALLDMNYYNRMVDEIVKTQDLIESQTVLRFFRDEFDRYRNTNFDIYNLESIVQEGVVDLAPPTGYAGDPFKYMANAVQFAIKGMIHKLTDAAKLDKLSFVIIGNPMATQLLSEWVTWKHQQGSSIGGIQVNDSYGFMTDMSATIRVVASNQINAYTKEVITPINGGVGDRELVLRIIAYPTDPEHISFRHLKYTSHLFATPAQAAYLSANAPQGAYSIVTATSRFRDVSIQGLQCELKLINSKRIYGSKK